MPKRSTRSRRNNKKYSSSSSSSSSPSKFSSEKEDEIEKKQKNNSSNSNNNNSIESSYNNSQEISEESSEDSIDEFQDLKEELNSQLNELVFYKIEMPSSSSNKKIISCIEKIIEIFNQIYQEISEGDINDIDVDNLDKKFEENEDNINLSNKITSEISDLDKNEKEKEKEKEMEKNNEKKEGFFNVNNKENNNQNEKYFNTFEVKIFLLIKFFFRNFLLIFLLNFSPKKL